MQSFCLTKFLILLLLPLTVHAFVPIHQQQQQQELRFSIISLKAKIDSAKIKDAARNFGKYSVEEIEEIKNELHQERIQNLSLNRNAVTGEQAAEQRLMEQELDLQLRLLQKENNKSSSSSSKLFPDEMVKDLPHLKDDGPISSTAAYFHHQEKRKSAKSKSDDFYMKELLMEENVIETVAFCSFLAIMMMAPNILH